MSWCAGDGLVVELLSGLRVLERCVIARHSCADGAPADAVAGLIKTHEGTLEPAGAGKQIRGWYMHVLQRKPAGDRGAKRPLAVNRVRAESRPVGLD